MKHIFKYGKKKSQFKDSARIQIEAINKEENKHRALLKSDTDIILKEVEKSYAERKKILLKNTRRNDKIFDRQVKKIIKSVNKAKLEVTKDFDKHILILSNGFKIAKKHLNFNKSQELKLIEDSGKYFLNKIKGGLLTTLKDKFELSNFWESCKIQVLCRNSIKSYKNIFNNKVENEQKLQDLQFVNNYFKYLNISKIIDSKEYDDIKSHNVKVLYNKNYKLDKNFFAIDKKIKTVFKSNYKNNLNYFRSMPKNYNVNSDFQYITKREKELKKFIDKLLVESKEKIIKNYNAEILKITKNYEDNKKKLADEKNKNILKLDEKKEELLEKNTEESLKYTLQISDLFDLYDGLQDAKYKINSEYRKKLLAISHNAGKAKNKINENLSENIKKLKKARLYSVANIATLVGSIAGYFNPEAVLSFLRLPVNKFTIETAKSFFGLTGTGSFAKLVDGKSSIGASFSVNIPSINRDTVTVNNTISQQNVIRLDSQVVNSSMQLPIDNSDQPNGYVLSRLIEPSSNILTTINAETLAQRFNSNNSSNLQKSDSYLKEVSKSEESLLYKDYINSNSLSYLNNKNASLQISLNSSFKDSVNKALEQNRLSEANKIKQRHPLFKDFSKNETKARMNNYIPVEEKSEEWKPERGSSFSNVEIKKSSNSKFVTVKNKKERKKILKQNPLKQIKNFVSKDNLLDKCKEFELKAEKDSGDEEPNFPKYELMKKEFKGSIGSFTFQPMLYAYGDSNLSLSVSPQSNINKISNIKDIAIDNITGKAELKLDAGAGVHLAHGHINILGFGKIKTEANALKFDVFVDGKAKVDKEKMSISGEGGFSAKALEWKTVVESEEICIKKFCIQPKAGVEIGYGVEGSIEVKPSFNYRCDKLKTDYKLKTASAGWYLSFDSLELNFTYKVKQPKQIILKPQTAEEMSTILPPSINPYYETVKKDRNSFDEHLAKMYHGHSEFSEKEKMRRIVHEFCTGEQIPLWDIKHPKKNFGINKFKA